MSRWMHYNHAVRELHVEWYVIVADVAAVALVLTVLIGVLT